MTAVLRANELITTERLIGRLRLNEDNNYTLEVISLLDKSGKTWEKIYEGRTFSKTTLDKWTEEETKEEFIELYRAAKKFAKTNSGSVRFSERKIITNILKDLAGIKR